jgi:hypothetical protein
MIRPCSHSAVGCTAKSSGNAWRVRSGLRKSFAQTVP